MFNLVNTELIYEDLKNRNKLIVVEGLGSLKKTKNDILVDENGLYSSKLGSISKINERTEKISCDCGLLTTNLYSGKVCSVCKTKVLKRDYKEISTIGFIDLENYKVMTPNGYSLVSKFLSSGKLKSIINHKITINFNGNNTTDTIRAKTKENFKNIGLLGFYQKYETILTDEFNKKVKKAKSNEELKNLTDLYNYLMTKKKRIFTSKIVVISTKLRNIFVTGVNIRQSAINQVYLNIQTSANSLKRNRLKINYDQINEILSNIQEHYNSLTEEIIDKRLTEKPHLTRKDIAGCNMHYCGRSVIIPNDENVDSIDQIQVSYRFFTAIFEPIIISYMMNISHIFKNNTIHQNINILRRSRIETNPNIDILNICRDILKSRDKENELCVLLNRAPTLKLGSIQTLAIKDIIYDSDDRISDNVMKVPLTSLEEFNGDFDGDTLQAYAILDKDILNMFRKALSPEALIISRTQNKYHNNEINSHAELQTMLYSLINKR